MARLSCVACGPARLIWLLLSLSSACDRVGNDALRQVVDAHTDQPHVRDETDAALQEEPDAGLLDAEVVTPTPDSSASPTSPSTDASVSPPEPVVEPDVEPDASVPLGKSMATRDSAYLFEQSQLRTFELFLHNKDLATLDADPAAEVYVPGQLVFEGGLIPNVGIRYKGSAGSFLGCVSGGFPPSGAKTCVKLGMKVKLDFDTKGTRFFGQKKLQFHAMNLDRSLLRERFAYGLFNAVGVQAPRTAHIRLLINGKLVGVFLLVEVLDDPFMEDRFVEDEGAGNLYKEAWPVGSDEARYLAAIEASGTKPANVTKIAAFARELAAADDVALPAVLARWIDLDYMARYVAVDRAIRHDDGPYHWYCGTLFKPDPWHTQRSYAGQSCGNHNYYWYEEAKRDRLWLLPWDLDLSLSPGGGVTQITSRWNDLNADCTQLLPGGLGSQMPITCDPLQRGVALALGERVRATQRMLVTGPLSEEALEVTLAPWIVQLRPAVEEAHLAHESEQDTMSWSVQVEGLRAALRLLREAAALDASCVTASGCPAQPQQ